VKTQNPNFTDKYKAFHMESKNQSTMWSAILCVVYLMFAASSSTAQGSAFTFQGQLSDAGSPANGNFEFQFSLFDSLTGGNLIGSANAPAPIPVKDGLFTAVLNFGEAAFDGSPRWLQIGVRTNGNAFEHIALTPRQQITATPYALFAGNVADGAITTRKIASGAITSDKIGPISRLSSPGGGLPDVLNVSDNGGVGIGTTTPTSRMEIHRDGDGSFLRLSRSPASQEFLDVVGTAIEGSGTAFSLYTRLWNGQGYDSVRSLTLGANGNLETPMNLSVTRNLDAGYLLLRPQSASQGGGLRLLGAESYPTWFVDAAEDRFRVFNDSNGLEALVINKKGNVGIGAAGVLNKFVIQAALGSDDFVGQQHSLQFQIQNGLGPSRTRAMGIGLLDNGKGVIQVKEANEGYNDLLLNPNVPGNVGIGTGTPTQKLDVAGAIAIYGSTVINPQGQWVGGLGNIQGSLSVAGVIESTVGGIKFPNGSILVGTGVGADLSGTLPNPTIRNAAVTESKISDSAVSSGKIKDLAVTTGKLADFSVNVAKLADNSVTDAKIVSVSWNKVADKPTTFPPGGPAGGDLIGPFPNLLIRPNTISAVHLSADPLLLLKISGGTMFASGSDLRLAGNLSTEGEIRVTNPSRATRVLLDEQEDGGVVAVRGSSGTPVAVLSHASGAPNRGAVSVIDVAGVVQASMFVGATGKGEFFADVKNFRIPNPKDDSTDIYYAAVEGPEAAAYIRGTGELLNGRATIHFPEHFKAVSVFEGMTVQVTPSSDTSKGLAVVSKSMEGIEVRELLQGTGTYQFDYEVKCIRKGHESYQVLRPRLATSPLGGNGETRSSKN
jgi:hypothetical protein